MLEPTFKNPTHKDMSGRPPTDLYLPTHGKSSTITTAKFGSKEDVHQKRKDSDHIDLDIRKKSISSTFEDVHSAISMSSTIEIHVGAEKEISNIDYDEVDSSMLSFFTIECCTTPGFWV